MPDDILPKLDILKEEIGALRTTVMAQSEMIDILWEMNAPSGKFRVLFDPNRFANEAQLADHLTNVIPSIESVTAAKNKDNLLGESSSSHDIMSDQMINITSRPYLYLIYLSIQHILQAGLSLHATNLLTCPSLAKSAGERLLTTTSFWMIEFP